MTNEEARKLAMRLRMPKFMRDSEECLSALANFGERVRSEEREACAKACEAIGPELIRWWGDGQANAAAQECATVIRMRSNVK